MLIQFQTFEMIYQGKIVHCVSLVGAATWWQKKSHVINVLSKPFLFPLTHASSNPLYPFSKALFKLKQKGFAQ